MFIKKLLFVHLIFLFVLQAHAEKQKITLYLDWLNQFQFAGYYIAKEKGYYDSFNLDVDIIEYSKINNVNIAKKVIENDAVYGIGKSSLIVDKFNGNDIILLSAIFQNSPMVLISLSSSNIKTPKDLINKNIMITNDAKESLSMKSLLLLDGVSFDDTIVKAFSSNQIDDLINKKVDAIACYLSNEPYILEEKKISYNVIHPENCTFDFYEGILFTSQKELQNNPHRVQNFNQASIRGWEYAFNNIEETAKIIHEKYNTQNKTLEALIYEGEVLKKLSKINEGLLGNISLSSINEIIRLYSILNLNTSKTFFETKSILFNKGDTLIDNNQLEYLKNKHFALLTQSDRVPFSFKNSNNLIGIEVDFWNLFSEKLKKSLSIEEVIKGKFLNIFSNSIKA